VKPGAPAGPALSDEASAQRDGLVLEHLLETLGPDGDWVSGSLLADKLGWARLELLACFDSLRARGYVLQAVPGRGYKLISAPDALGKEPLAPMLSLFSVQELGRALHTYDEIDSTNDEAHRLAEKGAPHGTVVLADAQTSGRGRRGRVWTTPKGKALAMSIVLRPGLPAARAPELAFAAALAVCETARALGAPQAALKWPNDVECGGRKLAGLLAELRAQGGALSHVVLGIGVNVNVEREDFPDELRALATSLCIESGAPVSRALVCAKLLASLEGWLECHAREGFAPLRARWKQLASTPGLRVRIEGTQPVIGVAEDMADDGALLVRTDAGELQRVIAGDVEHLRAIR